jgi:hypothetical protein
MNYRRFIFVVMAAVLVCSFAAAQEGLTPKLEVGFGDVADEAELSFTPGVEYATSFGAVDLSAELDYTVTLADPDPTHEIYEEVELGYNLSLGAASVLSIIVNNSNLFYLSPAPKGNATHEGTLEPSLLYVQTLDFGDVSAQLGFPIDYLKGEDGETSAEAYLTLGWASTFGLGVELTGTLGLSPDSEYSETALVLSYEQSIFYGEVEFTADKEFKTFGITPDIEISVDAWTFYVSATIGIPDGGDTKFSPAIGARYSF